ncbi:ROK family protein [Streptomyces sp. ISL-10]|uniref:ROK family protein n=1 Tax=Streptomyces sp. ISL-10 TaxID=2819172 RepID=UPI001BE90428|nr:ROK family protein [Streptomyces sp. ISL-10]MBT2368990.1 ROK family protein [Streptomyces sp. ISL-10]
MPIENDVNFAVLGEQWRGTAGRHGTGRRVRQPGVRPAGTQDRHRVIINGSPSPGSSAAAGELGFIDLVLDPDAPAGPRPADGTGPFERLVGAAAIHRLALEAGAPAGATRTTSRRSSRQRPVAVVDRVATRLARGLAALLLAPGRVVIGGVSREGEVLPGPVHRQVRLHTSMTVTVQASVLGEQAVAYGAVRHALDAAEERTTAG